MAEIKPIETVYKGYRFRSRLEARWAVFFDALGVQWEYEKEGYDLGKAGWYLPDFWLPEFGLFVEIKGDPLVPEDQAEKVRAMGHGGKPIVLFCGNPCEYSGILWCLETDDGGGGEYENDKVDWWVDLRGRLVLLCKGDFRERSFCGEDWTPLNRVINGADIHVTPIDIDAFCETHNRLSIAKDAARSARFEFGESGAHR